MWVQLENVDAIILRATDEEKAWLARYLEFREVRWGQDSVAKTMLSAGRGMLGRPSFPAGLWPMVESAAARDGVELESLDRRVRRAEIDPDADLGWLRPYQLDAVRALQRATRGIVKAATGSGKTEIAAAMVRAVPGRWLLVVHRITLVDQALERYELRTGRPGRHWRVGQPLEEGLQACTLQQAAQALRRSPEVAAASLAQVDGLIVDEAHVTPAETFYAVTRACSGAYWRVGLSGTPLDRTDRRSLMAIAALGRVVHRVEARDLIEEGVLARPTIRMLPVRQNAPFTLVKHDEVYRHLVVESDARNDAIVSAVRSAPKPCMVFVKMVDHGHVLTDKIRKAGMNAEFVWGASVGANRKRALRDLERGDVDVVVASVVFQEGVDVPSLEAVVVACGGKSVIAALQRIGRGMRTDGGRKQEFLVIDVDDRGSVLEAQARRRKNTYVREGHSVLVDEIDGPVPYRPVLRKRGVRP